MTPRFLLSTLLFAPAAALAGQAPAEILSDTTWTLADSPWTVDGEVSVAEGATLTIEPGVTVALAPDAGIRIAGELIARGTSDQPITFTTPQPDTSWGALVFEPGSVDAAYVDLDEYVSGSILEHAVVEHGSRAVQIDGASPLVRRVTFQENTYRPDFTEGGGALLISDGAAPRIVECEFLDNVVEGTGYGGAIYVDYADPILQDNRFEGNVSAYGGAIVTVSMYAPIVGNTLIGNEAEWEGGGISLMSSSLALLNNQIHDNHTLLDGGGVHVCVTCYPHASPFLFDNAVTGNTNVGFGAGGVGAAWLRGFAHNDVHDNTTDGAPGDFAWHNDYAATYPDWACQPQIPDNWWGTTDPAAVAEAIFDGADEEGYGEVSFLPVSDAPVAAPATRATITTEKIRYGAVDEPMRVFLSLYNPGESRVVDLLITLRYEGLPPAVWRGELDYEGAERLADGRIRLTLPDNAAWFAPILSAPLQEPGGLEEGAWGVAVFDAETGARLGDAISAQFVFGGSAPAEGETEEYPE